VELLAYIRKTDRPFFLSDIRSVAAVVALKGEGCMVGLVRMVQSSAEKCVIDATMDGLPAGDYTVNIHELGDLSQGGDR